MDTPVSSEKIIHYKATKTLPEVLFIPDGTLKIAGKMINDDLADFFEPLIAWVKNCTCDKATVEIDLEYINTSGVFLIEKLLKTLDTNHSIKEIEVVWKYDEDDQEHYDIGHLISQSLTRSKLNFESKESDNCSYDSFLQILL